MINDKLNKIKGAIYLEDKIAPAYINTKNPKWIEIDNLFYSGLIVVNYNREFQDIILKNLIENNINLNISLFYEKQDKYKIIRDLTYHIGTVGAELKDIKENNQEIDIASFAYQDAKYIRKELQVNNEEIYFLYLYLILFSNDTKELETNLNKIEGICNANGIFTRRATFRQEAIFLSTLPIAENHTSIKNAARRNILTEGLTSTYPFISSSIFEEEGVFIGSNIYNKSFIFIDRFKEEKYKNANMCIFGTSGARKIFFYKTNDIKI